VISVRTILRASGLLTDLGTWLEEGLVLGCAYPRRDAVLAGLARQGISVLINLHERAHDPDRLARYSLTEVHVPVTDFTAPSSAQVERAVAAIIQALAAGKQVAVHCGGGIGRTGTVLACYLVRKGLTAAEAIARVRALRPGSVETREQAAAVESFARRKDQEHRIEL
jgi:atypical dual specificity phosphatase